MLVFFVLVDKFISPSLLIFFTVSGSSSLLHYLSGCCFATSKYTSFRFLFKMSTEQKKRIFRLKKHNFKREKKNLKIHKYTTKATPSYTLLQQKFEHLHHPINVFLYLDGLINPFFFQQLVHIKTVFHFQN